jgi:DNA-binding PadR family transcriptional regulator
MRHRHHDHHGCGSHGVAAMPLVLAMAGHRGGPGPRGWGHRGFSFGPEDWGGRPRRGRGRRGDVRAAILLLLEEEPRNGYGLMQEVEERSDGAWRPSPGSVYPALSQLEDEGLIAPSGGEQGKTFALTDAGRAHVEEHRERLGKPWEQAQGGRPDGFADLRNAIGQVATAAMQVAQTGDAALLASAREILDTTRKQLYRLLAGDDE